MVGGQGLQIVLMEMEVVWEDGLRQEVMAQLGIPWKNQNGGQRCPRSVSTNCGSCDIYGMESSEVSRMSQRNGSRLENG